MNQDQLCSELLEWLVFRYLFKVQWLVYSFGILLLDRIGIPVGVLMKAVAIFNDDRGKLCLINKVMSLSTSSNLRSLPAPHCSAPHISPHI